MIGFYPNTDCATRLGELAGAFDTDVAAAFEIILGPDEPPRTRVSVALEGGRAVQWAAAHR
jgi:hypothetical protein